MILKDFKPFIGQHCETTAIGSLLQHEGLALSEALLFGIGSGLNFIYWNMKGMPVPFLGGRSKTLIDAISSHLEIEFDVKETTSLKKAWNTVVHTLQNGRPIGLQVDCYYLEYFRQKIHFAGHHLALYGFDEQNAFLNDTLQQASLVETSLVSLSSARSEKGPMSAKNKSYSIATIPDKIDLKQAIIRGIQKNSQDYLNPPITNISFKGILKTSKEIIKWLEKHPDPTYAFSHTAMMMEKAGTGGALFRNIYRDFLGEAVTLLQLESLHIAEESFREIASKWSQVSALFIKYANTENPNHIKDASALLVWISNAEKEAFELLSKSMKNLK